MRTTIHRKCVLDDLPIPYFFFWTSQYFADLLLMRSARHRHRDYARITVTLRPPGVVAVVEVVR